MDSNEPQLGRDIHLEKRRQTMIGHVKTFGIALVFGLSAYALIHGLLYLEKLAKGA